MNDMTCDDFVKEQIDFYEKKGKRYGPDQISDWKDMYWERRCLNDEDKRIEDAKKQGTFTL